MKDSTHQQTREQMRELIGIICDQGAAALTSEQREDLNNLLRESPALRQEYAGLMDLHGQLITKQQWAPAEVVPFVSARPIPQRHSLRSIAAIAAVLVAGLFLLFWLMGRGIGGWTMGGGYLASREAAADTHLATLIESVDAVWQGGTTYAEGAPIGAGVLDLAAGEAAIRTRSGIRLYLNQGTRLELKTGNSAYLERGEIYFVNTETEWLGAPFLIQTPKAELEHLGTRYSIAVKADGVEELFVEEGAVIRKDSSGREEHIAQQSARRWSQTQQAGEEITFAKAAYYRRAAKRSDRGLPIVRETFDLAPDLAASLELGSGVGVKNTWLLWHGGQAVAEAEGASLGDFVHTEQGLITSQKAAVAGRLKIPIDLAQDEVTYFSFDLGLDPDVLRQSRSGGMYFAFRCADEVDQKIQISLTSRRKAAFRLETKISHYDSDLRGKAMAALPISPTETELRVVGKIVSHAAAADQIFVRVLPSYEEPSELEPWAWSLVGQSAAADFSLEWLTLHFRQDGGCAVKEIRLGRSWNSVVRVL